MNTYTEKLADPRWQKKRLLIFERDKWTCKICGNTHKQLEIHHTEYFEGMKPWEYPDDMLTTLCRSCHEQEQQRPKHEKYLIQSLLSAGFMVPDLVAMSVLINRHSWFTKFILRITRRFANS